MGMPIAQSTQPISQQQPGGKGSQQYQSNPQSGKGMAQPTKPMGDFGDPNLNQPMPALLQKYSPNVMPQGGDDFNAPMGGSNGQATAPNGQPQGKSQGGFASNMQMPPPPPQQQGKGSTTNSATSGQPRMGQSNPYPNTIQPWDNASIQPQTKSGKGKGY